MNPNSYTKPQLCIRLEEAIKQIDILKTKLAAEMDSRSDFNKAIEYFRYCMDFFTSTGATKEEAFQFITDALKGALFV